MFNLFRPSSCRAQFEKVGLGSDECKEVLERLLDIKYKWVILQFMNWSSFYLLNYFFSFLKCLSYLILSLMNFICSCLHRYEPSTDFWGTNFRKYYYIFVFYMRKYCILVTKIEFTLKIYLESSEPFSTCILCAKFFFFSLFYS